MQTIDRHLVLHNGVKLVLCTIAITSGACTALMSDRKAHEEQHEQMVQTMDKAHLFVTSQGLPKDKPYVVLGELKYSEPYTPDALDEDSIEKRLKTMAMAKYSDQADAVIDAKGEVDTAGDTSTVTVTGQVVRFERSADREMMHNMQEDLVVSPR